MKIIAAAYGETYMIFAAVLAESLRRSGIGPLVLVHGDARPGQFPPFPDHEVIPVDARALDVGRTRTERVARKLAAWRIGLEECQDGEEVIFLDADTMVLKPLSPAFGTPFDLAYTDRPGRWPINSGVVFARKSSRVLRFFDDWVAVTEWLLADPDRLQVAKDRHGSADQAGLLMAARLHAGHEGLIFSSLPCEVWNQDRCVEDLSQPAVVHLKGCLPLLLKQREYGPHVGDERDPGVCEPIFDLWRSMLPSGGGS